MAKRKLTKAQEETLSRMTPSEARNHRKAMEGGGTGLGKLFKKKSKAKAATKAKPKAKAATKAKPKTQSKSTGPANRPNNKKASTTSRGPKTRPKVKGKGKTASKGPKTRAKVVGKGSKPAKKGPAKRANVVGKAGKPKAKSTPKGRSNSVRKQVKSAKSKSVPGRGLIQAIKNSFTGKGPTSPKGVAAKKKRMANKKPKR